MDMEAIGRADGDVYTVHDAITGPWKEGQKSLLIAIGCFGVVPPA